MNPFKSRYAVLVGFIATFLFLSFVVRLILTMWSWHEAQLHYSDLFIIYSKGLIFDLAVALFFCSFYSVYLLLIPEQFNRSLVNRILTYVSFFIALLICMFAFFAETTFWKEFDSRFNFIAVDYLVYTYEVVNNIE